jgi:hypothetical protein
MQKLSCVTKLLASFAEGVVIFGYAGPRLIARVSEVNLVAELLRNGGDGALIRDGSVIV